MGTRESITYDAADRVTRVANLNSGGTTLSSFNYDLDAVGNRLACLEEGGIRVSWTYDDTYQLTREQRNGANSYDVTHVYDEVGNRTVQIDGGSRTTFTYNAANQITKQEVGGVVATLTYDANGNARTAEVPGDPIITLTWDYENRLVEKAQTPVKTANDYDPDGLRVRRRQFLGAVVVATDKHVWDEQNILLETDASDVTQRIFTYEPALFGNLVSKRASGATEYYHFDALGSTRQTTDGSQAIARSYAFRAFGEYVLGSWDVNQPFTWVGRHGSYDDFDRFYIRARHYSAGIAVWLSEDEIDAKRLQNKFTARILGEVVEVIFPEAGKPGMIILKSRGPNTAYSYSGNCPANEMDPSGLAHGYQPPFKPDGHRFVYKSPCPCHLPVIEAMTKCIPPTPRPWQSTWWTQIVWPNEPPRGPNTCVIVDASAGEERRANGCGGKGGIDIPDLAFKNCCDDHDRCYSNCGAGNRKFRCDDNFLHCMTNACLVRYPRQTPDWWSKSRSACLAAAYAYYKAVDQFGDSFFLSGKENYCACCCPRKT